jgi:lipoprotein-anchoring transpeptidase ErfK/SrfK
MRKHRTGSTLRVSLVATFLAATVALAGPLTARFAAGRAAAQASPPARSAAAGAPLPAGPHPSPADLAAARAAARAAQPQPALLVHVRPGLVARTRPSAQARSLGTVATVSKYYRVPIVLWVERTSRDGRWGRVELPYVFPRRDGWIPLAGLARARTWIRVEVDLSSHTLRVFNHDRRRFVTRAAIGAPSSPTPPGEYFVTDRVPFSAGGSLGSFAFGISGIQPRLPAGWSGGNQLAIHGTNDPSSIGRSVSAGCVRVSEAALARLLPLLRLGTPVVIVP